MTLALQGAPDSWLELYVPWSRLDAGLLTLLGIWLAIVACGFALWWRGRRGALRG